MNNRTKEIEEWFSEFEKTLKVTFREPNDQKTFFEALARSKRDGREKLLEIYQGQMDKLCSSGNVFLFRNGENAHTEVRSALSEIVSMNTRFNHVETLWSMFMPTISRQSLKRLCMIAIKNLA